MKSSNILYYLRILLNILVISAFAWCVWTGCKIWTTPITYSGIEIKKKRDGNIRHEVMKTKSFADISGAGSFPLLLPIFITSIALGSLFVLRTTLLVIATCLFSIFWFISGFSIGAYTPALLLLIGSLAICLLSKRFNIQGNA